MRILSIIADLAGGAPGAVDAAEVPARPLALPLEPPAAKTAFERLMEARAEQIVRGSKFYLDRPLFARAELDAIDAAVNACSGGPPQSADDHFFAAQLSGPPAPFAPLGQARSGRCRKPRR